MARGRDPDGATWIVVPDPQGPGETSGDADEDNVVSDPARILRLASMAQALLTQIQATELDPASRHRLAEVFNRTITSLRELLSADLQREVDELQLPLPDDPTDAEMRVAQAQLVGWLEGLFHGVRSTLIAHRIATQEELARALEQGIQAAQEESEKRAAGHYL